MSVEQHLSDKIKTPRGEFRVYDGTWVDFQNEDDTKEWGVWFEYSTDDILYKIMHNYEKQHAIAVIYKSLHESINKSCETEDIQSVLGRTNKMNNKKFELKFDDAYLPLADYIYDEMSIFRGANGHADYDEKRIPTYEEIIEYFDDRVSREAYDSVVKTIRDNLDNLKYYEGDIELSDRSIVNELNVDMESEDYWNLVDEWCDKFNAEFNTDLRYNGRSYKHVVIDDTIENVLRYNELKDAIDKYQDDFVSYINDKYTTNDTDNTISIKPDSNNVEINVNDNTATGDDGHPIQKGLRGSGNISIKESIEKQEDVFYKGFTIEHFPYSYTIGKDGKELDVNGYVIHSPYYLQSTPDKPKTYLPLYCEDEEGNEFNLNSLEDAKKYIDDYLSQKKGKIVIKNGDEVHYVINPDELDESLKEEYGYYQGEVYCDRIAEYLEDGSEYGVVMTPYGNGEVEWELDINGHNSRDFECDEFFEYLLDDISYPVRDGHLSYIGLDTVIPNDSFNERFDKEDFKHDLEMLGVYDEESFNKFYSDEDYELEFWIDYDTNFDVDEWEELVEAEENEETEDDEYSIYLDKALDDGTFERLADANDLSYRETEDEIFIKGKKSDLEYFLDNINYEYDEDDLTLEESFNGSKVKYEPLEYTDLPITVYGGRRSWETGDYEERETSIDWVYNARIEDVKEVLSEYVSENISDEELDNYVNEHYDELLTKYYDDVLDYFRGDAIRDAQENNEEEFDIYPDMEESLKEGFTKMGRQIMKDANEIGLSDFYDAYNGVFWFTKEDYDKNQDKIKAWIEKHPDYGVLTQSAKIYKDTDFGKSSDGRVYFLSDCGFADDEIGEGDEILIAPNTNKNAVTESLSGSELYKKLKSVCKEDEIDTHRSDLYVKVKPETTQIINDYEYANQVSTFKDNITHTKWYEIPFVAPILKEGKENKVPASVRKLLDLINGDRASKFGYELSPDENKIYIGGVSFDMTKQQYKKLKELGIADNSKELKEGAEGKKERGFEYIIYIAESDETAPIVGKRTTYVEAQNFANDYFKKKKVNCGIEKVPTDRFKVGDDFIGPFDADYNPIKESLEERLNVPKLTTFIKDAVSGLLNGNANIYRYKLDNKLALFVGWSSGYGKTIRDDVIQNPKNPDEAINYGIKVWTSDNHWVDYDMLNFPYYNNGEVIDISMSAEKEDASDDYQYVVNYLSDMYENKLRDLNIDKDGLIIEDENLKENLSDKTFDYKSVEEAENKLKELGIDFDEKKKSAGTNDIHYIRGEKKVAVYSPNRGRLYLVDEKLEESLNESSLAMDSHELSDGSKIKMGWDKNDGYYVEVIIPSNSGNGFYRTEKRQTFPTEERARNYYKRLVKQADKSQVVSEDFTKEDADEVKVFINGKPASEFESTYDDHTLNDTYPNFDAFWKDARRLIFVQGFSSSPIAEIGDNFGEVTITVGGIPIDADLVNDKKEWVLEYIKDANKGITEAKTDYAKPIKSKKFKGYKKGELGTFQTFNPNSGDMKINNAFFNMSMGSAPAGEVSGVGTADGSIGAVSGGVAEGLSDNGVKSLKDYVEKQKSEYDETKDNIPFEEENLIWTIQDYAGMMGKFTSEDKDYIEKELNLPLDEILDLCFGYNEDKDDMSEVSNIVKECIVPISEGKISELDIDIKNAGGIDKFIEEKQRELNDLQDYLIYLNSQAMKEIGRGGNFDSQAEIDETVDETSDKINEIKIQIELAKTLEK